MGGRGHEEIKLRVLRDFVVNKKLSVAISRSAVEVDNLGGWKTVEIGRCRSAIGTDVSAVEEVVTLQVNGEFFRHRNNVQPVTGRTKHSADLGRPCFESVKVILTVVENYTGKSVIDAVIDVIA